MRGLGRTMSTLFLATVLSGCYAYAEVDRGAVAPGSVVRVVLDRQEAVRQVDVLGGLRERVEGQVAPQTNGTGLSLMVRQTATPAQGGMFNAFATFPWSSVGLIEVKRFSPVRTALVAGGGAAVAIAVLSVLEGSSKKGDGEGPITDDNLRIPLLRFRW